jgi:ABC transporter substrate binding protein
VQKRIDAFMVPPVQLFTDRRVQIVTLAVLHRLPAIYASREFAEVDGLMSYGPDSADQGRLVGIYTGRVLKGEKPTDLPVMQPAKFKFVINLQTARTIGINVPPTLGSGIVSPSAWAVNSVPPWIKDTLKTGALVRRGQVIGLAGQSGNANGPHLHFCMGWATVFLRAPMFHAD